jgi:protoporphyrinogen oxidase
MSHTRRDFIRYVVAGSIASGCPIDQALLAEPGSARSGPVVEGEHFNVCHQVRDGHSFPKPDATKKADVVIVGGGVAGLSAAYFLKGKDWLLLEKEDHFGGNAYQEEYEGHIFGTGSAYGYRGDDGDMLAKEIGLNLPLINMPDPIIDNGKYAPDIWRTGINDLPYSKDVIASFKKYRDDMMKIDVKKNAAQLDSEPFAKYLAGYAPEITKLWNAYGPSNWGAFSEDTSALIGIADSQNLIQGLDDQRVILPGGLGCITHKLVEVLKPQHSGQMLSDATVVRVVPDKDEVEVTYAQGDKISTVAAKVVLMCTQKHITARLVTGLPSEQKQAMRRMRYAPYPIINLIFDEPIYRKGYDNWCPGKTFTDFIVADWTIRSNPGYKPKYNILTFYTPLRESERSLLLNEDDCKTLAAKVLKDFQGLMPDLNVDPVEVRLYRRGHPMFMSVPEQFTKNRMIASQPMERVFFGNSDSGGPESLTSEAVRISYAGVEWANLVLAGKPGAAELAHKALTETLL